MDAKNNIPPNQTSENKLGKIPSPYYWPLGFFPNRRWTGRYKLPIDLVDKFAILGVSRCIILSSWWFQPL